MDYGERYVFKESIRTGGTLVIGAATLITGFDGLCDISHGDVIYGASKIVTAVSSLGGIFIYRYFTNPEGF